MYCKKCNTLLTEESKTCPNCYYDNDLNTYQDATVELQIIQNQAKPNKNKPSKTPIIILLILLITGFIFIYILNEKKEKEENLKTTTTSLTTKEVEKKFKYQKIKLLYTDNFEIEDNSLIYIKNSNINIKINEITEEDYNTYNDLNECLDSKLNSIETKTFAEELSYSHIFFYKNKYYILTVNYIADTNIYTEEIQLEISNIINTIA